MNESIQRLKELYANTSKHSNYQILPDLLYNFIGNEDIQVKSRYERERLTYILSVLEPQSKTILDVGGNTGFFSFEMLSSGASRVILVEGNKEHAEFVTEASKLLKYDDKLIVLNKYLNFNNEFPNDFFDIVLLLNVLHHVGDDYGDEGLSLEKAKEQIIRSLNSLASKAHYLVFQLGFCWKGDRNLLLFSNGSKKEMIDFVANGVNSFWEIMHIGIPETDKDGKVYYKVLDEENISRNDSLGEFLNRPLFILKSKLKS